MLTQAELKSQLYYNPETGIFTRIASNHHSVKIGDVAGNLCSGYINIRVFGKIYKAHRLCFLYMEGKFPDEFVDHIDMNKSNNAWSNLRESSTSENNRNVTKRANNKSGYKGVCSHGISKKWMAQATLNGKKIHLGIYDTPELAHDVYVKFAKQNHGEFYRD